MTARSRRPGAGNLRWALAAMKRPVQLPVPALVRLPVLLLPTLALVLLWSVGCQAPSTPAPEGVRIVAGGDAVLLATTWSDSGERRPLRDPLDWVTARHRAVTLSLLELESSFDDEFSHSLPFADLPESVAPNLPPETVARIDSALGALSETPSADAELKQLDREFLRKGWDRLAIWLQVARYRQIEFQTQSLPEATIKRLQQVLVDDPETLYWLWIDLGLRASSRGHLETARRIEAALLETPTPLAAIASAWHDSFRASLSFERRQTETAREAFESALEAAIAAGDKGALQARIAIGRGSVALTKSQIEAAREQFQHALEQLDSLGLNGRLRGYSLAGLSRCSMRQGQFYLVRREAEEAARIGMRIGGVFEATMRMNLSAILQRFREFGAARNHIDRAIEIMQRVSPGSSWEATALSTRAELASVAWELPQALADSERAAKIRRAIDPESLASLSSQLQLAELALYLKEFDKAESYLKQALQIGSRRSPHPLVRSIIYQGRLAQARGDHVRAEKFFRQSLDHYARLYPGDLALARSQRFLGLALFGQERWQEAEAAMHETVRLTARLKFERARAEALVTLAKLSARRSDLDQATTYCERAIDELEGVFGRAASTALGRGEFQQQFDHVHRSCIDLRLEAGDVAGAFQLLEQFRARQFLQSLAERQTLFSARLPEKLVRQRTLWAQKVDRLSHQLARLQLQRSGSPELVTKIERGLVEADRERIKIQDELRRVLPELASLQSPEVLSVDQTSEALADGTLLVSYSIGATSSLVFTLDADGTLEVERLALGRQELDKLVERFRRLIPEARLTLSIGEQRSELLRLTSQQLYQQLLTPIERRIANAKRLLVLPDASLALLPFGALQKRGGSYLIEHLPVHTVLSATVYDQLDRPSDPAAELALLAIGEPSYETSERTERLRSQQALEEPALEELAEGGPLLPPLPYSRVEVEGIAKLFPSNSTRTLLGVDATKQRLKEDARKALVLHISAHGFVDNRYPLNSGLALSSSETTDALGNGNGTLHTREIFEELQLNSDLVVLSACETGLGKLAGGEGLVGLTRAFQYAGSRSVVASLWRISDRATSELMLEFYRRLVAGVAIDEALQQAQVALLQSGTDSAAPYYWAAFQLTGRPERLRSSPQPVVDTSPRP